MITTDNKNLHVLFIISIVFYAVGYNKYNCLKYKVSHTYKANVHAEVDALTNLKPNSHKKCRKISLFVFRIGGDNNLLMAKPCQNCMKSIYKIASRKGYNIQTIYYTNNNIVDTIKV
jgi:deoxycytidylate deaminase